jgi:tRNA pseudouridine55 synthase
MPAGILLVDKPAGWTSNRTTRTVQRKLGARTAGHLGTLDPFATGLLPVMLGAAARLAPWVEGGTKTYRVGLLLGVATDTLDRDGVVTARRPVPDGFAETLLRLLPEFTGTIRQRIPDYSAAKVAGRRRCDRVRDGESLPEASKDVRIERLRLVGVDPEGEGAGGARGPVVEFEVACGGGTYVRQLGADLGERLGCGAHATRLRRTGVGPFDLAEAVTPAELDRMGEGEGWRCCVRLVGRLPGPEVAVDEATWARLSRGNPAAVPAEAGGADGVVFVRRGGVLWGVAEISGGELRPKRILVPEGIPFG